MFPFELEMTKPFPKSVRARYRKEARGFILAEKGKNFVIQVNCRRPSIRKKLSLEGAKCTAEVESVFSKQAHGFYSLLTNEWDINIDEYGTPAVDLDRLAVVTDSGRNRQQRSERGKFYLEFKLIFADGDVGACFCTDDMLDESYKETCQPKIKSWNPQCGVAGEEVWIQCYCNVAKTKSVQAILSYLINGHEREFFVDCDVDGKLVKFILPSLYDKIPPAEKTELQLRIVVDKDDNITSNKVEFGYLASKFNRPEAPQSDSNKQGQGVKFSRKRKVPVDTDRSRSKTFDSKTMLESLSLNHFIETAEPKCMSHCTISKEENPLKAFSQDSQNRLVDEKVKSLIARSPGDEVPHEVTLQNQDRTFVQEQDYNFASSSQAIVTKTTSEKQLRDGERSCQRNIGDETCRLIEQETSTNLSPGHDHVNNIENEQEIGLGNISTSVCEDTPKSTHFGNYPTPNNPNMYDPALSSLTLLRYNPESDPLFEDSGYYDASLDISDSYLYQLQTVLPPVSKNNTGDTSEDNAGDFRGTDANDMMQVSAKIPPDRYSAHDHNPGYDNCESEQPKEKILKMG